MNTQTLQDISIESIDPNPANPRQDIGDITELAASIAEQGVQQNLVVVPTSESRYTVVIGHRRLAAATQAGLASVPCAVRDWDETTQREIMLVENTQRSDLTALEEGDGYQGLLDLGVSIEQAAQRTGRSQSTVRRRLSIAAIPQAARNKAEAGQPTIEQWQAIAELADQSDLQEQLAAKAGTKDWDYTLKQTTERAARRRWYAAARAFLDQQQLAYETEQPNDSGYYRTPEGYRDLATFTPGKPFEQQAQAWRETQGGDIRQAARIAIREHDASTSTWSEGIALYAKRNTEQEDAEQAERDAYRKRQREQREAEEAPLKAHAETSRILRREFMTRLLELKNLPRKTDKGVMTLASQAIHGYLARRIDTWSRDPGEVLQALHGLGLDGQQETSENNDKEEEDEEYESSTAELIARAVESLDPAHRALALAYASIETSISWQDWRQADSLEQALAPLYAALEALGYQTSQDEQDGLDGTYLPAPEPDERDEEEENEESESETTTEEESETAKDETQTEKEPEESEASEQ
jgi:ParB family chromosome partitioning protein